METIAGVLTYVSTPAGEYAKDKAVIIVTGKQAANHPLVHPPSVLMPVQMLLASL